MADPFDWTPFVGKSSQQVTSPPTLPNTPVSTGSNEKFDWSKFTDSTSSTPYEGISKPGNLSVRPNTLQDTFREWIGKHIPGLLTATGGTLGGLTGAAEGGVGAIPGAALGAGAGSLAGQQLQKMSPRTFGAPPESEVGQTAQDAILGGAGPEALGAVGSKLINPKINLLASPLLRNTKPVQQALSKDAIDAGTAKLEGMISGAVPTEFTQKALADVTSMNRFKAMHGPQEAEQIALGDLTSKGFSPSAGTIDPDKILKAFDGPKSDVYAAGISTDTAKNVKELMQTIKDAQAQGKESSGVISYLKHRLVFDAAMFIPEALTGAAVGHEAIGAAAGVGTVILTDSAIKSAMSNPVTAKAVIAAIKTPSSAPVSPLLGKVIANGLRGSYVLYQGPEDKLEKAYVDDKGQLTYSRPTQ